MALHLANKKAINWMENIFKTFISWKANYKILIAFLCECQSVTRGIDHYQIRFYTVNDFSPI